MKKYIVILLVIVSTIISAQDKSFLELYSEYKSECDVIVTDIITENGVVTYKISPSDGDLKLIPKDTVWNTVFCPDYKESILYFSNTWIGGTSTGSYLTVDNIGTYTYSTPSTPEFTSEITRQKYCECKLKEDTWDGFHDWLKENKYIK